MPETVENLRTAVTLDEESAPKQDSAIERAEDSARPDPVTAEDRDESPSIRIAELKLCRKVERFGSFEPLDTTALRTGRTVLVYCEVAGLEYRARGDQFVSRLASHLELRAENGPLIWEQALPTAEDSCRRPRRDYFVWYRVMLPRSLEPGSYRLRLIQTDLIAERTTSAEVALSIAN
jgi:hypothetical protein